MAISRLAAVLIVILRRRRRPPLSFMAQGFLRCRGGGCRAGLATVLQSYLTHRVECVRRGSDRSTLTTVWFGVPQGSVLDPLLFILYTAGLMDLIEGHGLRPHLYADDTQTQGSCHPGSVAQLQSTLSTCLDDVLDWMRTNRLQLNTSKTEILTSPALPTNDSCSCRSGPRAAINKGSRLGNLHRQ